MQKLESALLILDQLPALGDIFQCDSGTSFGQRKTIHPKDSRWNVIILIGNFTKRTGLSCQNGAATEFRHICLKQLGKALAYRLADGELNRSPQFAFRRSVEAYQTQTAEIVQLVQLPNGNTHREIAKRLQASVQVAFTNSGYP